MSWFESVGARRGRAVMLGMGLVTATAAHGQGVKVALIPASQTVAPGSQVNLTMQVTRMGSNFNAFDAYIGFDPGALTQAAHEEGSYFTAACPNRYQRWMTGGGRDTITEVLLCNGVSVTGPGEIYRLHFTASSTPQVTTVRFLPGLQFFNAGLYVNPDSSSDAIVVIGAVGVGGDPAGPSTARLRVAPNPSRASMVLSVEMNREGIQQLLIMDLQGRVIRRLQNGFYEAGRRTVSWDRMSDSGRVVSPGVYMAALSAAGKTIRTRFTVLN